MRRPSSDAGLYILVMGLWVTEAARRVADIVFVSSDSQQGEPCLKAGGIYKTLLSPGIAGDSFTCCWTKQ
jgi:hypothetical protein